jgi:hypothetical protein
MKHLLLLTAMLFAANSQAALVSVSGQGKIVSPKSVQEDYPTNTKQWGFNEQQGVVLTRDVFVDDTVIAKGTKVDSHLIFLNSKGTKKLKKKAKWTFDGDIIGVMSDKRGTLIKKSNDLFAAFDDYFTKGKTLPFNNAGFEGSIDEYILNSFGAPTMLEVTMKVREPGDWIRVLTLSQDVSAVPVPAAAWLFAPALIGFMGLRRKVKKA